MARPDLSTPEGVAAYRAEIRSVARPARLTGFVLVILGAIAVVAGGWNAALEQVLVTGGYVLLGVGWVLLVAAIFMRTRHHRRRMAESE